MVFSKKRNIRVGRERVDPEFMSMVVGRLQKMLPQMGFMRPKLRDKNLDELPLKQQVINAHRSRVLILTVDGVELAPLGIQLEEILARPMTMKTVLMA